MARIVSEEEYYTFIRQSGAVENVAVRKPGGIGEIEVWTTPSGERCAWIFVRYFKGEHDYDFYIEG